MLKDLKTVFAHAQRQANANPHVAGQGLQVCGLRIDWAPAKPDARPLQIKSQSSFLAYMPAAVNRNLRKEPDAEDMFFAGFPEVNGLLRIVRRRGEPVGRDDQPAITPFVLRFYVGGKLACGLKLPHCCVPGCEGVILRQHQDDDGSTSGVQFTMQKLLP